MKNLTLEEIETLIKLEINYIRKTKAPVDVQKTSFIRGLSAALELVQGYHKNKNESKVDVENKQYIQTR